MARDDLKLAPADLRWTCDPSRFTFETTDEVEPTDATVGQDRALKALKLGLALFNPGYNIFVSGLTGTGKSSAVKAILERIKPALPLPLDRAYVNRFRDPYRPRLLTLARGDGVKLKEGMDELVRYLLKNVPMLFEDENYLKRREEIMEKYGEEEKVLFAGFSEELKSQGFTLAQVQIGPFTRPEIFFVHDGKAWPVDKLKELSAEGKIDQAEVRRVRRGYARHRHALEKILERSRELAKGMVTDLDDLSREMGRLAISGNIIDLKTRFPVPEVLEYLDEVQDHVLANLEVFRARGGTQADNILAPNQARAEDSEAFKEYRVNVVLDNSKREGAPVIIEANPTYSNLFGTIERVVDARGNLSTDFTKIKPGSILQADGGYLVANAFDLFSEPGVWRVLKRALKNRKILVQPPDVAFFFGQCSLKPDPIDVNVKVILIGDWYIYHYLYHFEPEFKKIFKVLADFESDMPLDDAAVESYARFVKRICRDENLMHFEASGVARLVEYGVWRTGRREKITAHFSDIADIVRESSFWASEAGATAVSADHVRKTIRAGIERHSLPEDRFREFIARGTVMVEIRGSRVGQINGLSVFDLANYSFGAPVRITATVSTGRAGIINIEREARLSGRTHDKGMLILAGYLRSTYAKNRNMELSASLCFEQSYGGVDGDSASAAEALALLSALSELPLDQSIAVTGSINQMGEMQSVGGINAKVEGYFRTCRALGFEGPVGVVIPRGNVKDLMLKEDVVDAVAKGDFRVFAASSIDECVEILTGVPAGASAKPGRFAPGGVHARVLKRLKAFSDSLERGESGAGREKSRKRKSPAPGKAGKKRAAKRKTAGKGRGSKQ